MNFADPGARVVRARLAKAETLVSFLRQYGITAALAEVMDAEDWRKVASCANVNPPSTETQQIVLDRLRGAERAEFEARLNRLVRRARRQPRRPSVA